MNQTAKQKNTKVLKISLLVIAGMFAFCFALVPLYTVFCNVTGINGKVENKAQVAVEDIDSARTVKVQFLATNNAGLPWEFHPNDNEIKLHPGQMQLTSFYAKNTTDHAMTVQAIPSVSPGLAAKHLKKIECFCFTQQSLDAHQGRDMPLKFVFDKDLPKDIKEITISYTLFDLTKQAS